MGHGLTPEIVSATDTPTTPFMKQGAEHATIVNVKFSSGAVDSGNTGQTHILRAGLTVAFQTGGAGSGEWIDYLDNEANGRGTAMGFLVHSINMKNDQGTARDTWGLVVIGGQPLIEEDLVYGLDENGIGDLEHRFLFSTDYEA